MFFWGEISHTIVFRWDLRQDLKPYPMEGQVSSGSDYRARIQQVESVLMSEID